MRTLLAFFLSCCFFSYSYASMGINLATGSMHPTIGEVGIEQIAARYDPRYERILCTLQWFDTVARNFGGDPFLCSSDQGLTWKKANGEPYPIPIDYLSGETPYDHIGRGESSGWLHPEIGVSPKGYPWMLFPTLSKADNRLPERPGIPYLYIYRDPGWIKQEVPGTSIGKTWSCGVTLHYMVLVYSNRLSPNILYAMASRDDGMTWSEPFFLDAVAPSQTISWISFVQPSDEYSDDTARFFYAYYNNSSWNRESWNAIKWIRFSLREAMEGKVTLADVNILNVAKEFTWVYKLGIKQHLGAYKNGLSIQQVTQGTSNEYGKGNNIMWANEFTDRAGVTERVTGESKESINPGGSVAFDQSGRIWFTYGGRRSTLPLYRSKSPYDLNAFDLVARNYEKTDSSTCAVLLYDDPNIIMIWRAGRSNSMYTTLKYNIYNSLDFE